MRKEMRPDIFTVGIQPRADGGAEIKIEMGRWVDAQIRSIAMQRGKIVPEMIGEALRCERLLADGRLYIRQDGQVRQLISA